MSDAIKALIAAEALPASYAEVVDRHWAPLADQIVGTGKRPLVVGVNGAQGSGKSTLCHFLEVLLADRGLRAVTLSLDDLYLTKAQRLEAARTVHPLFATRGVPGTHDVALGMEVLDAVAAGRDFTLPRFDKSIDDRAPQGEPVRGPVDVLLLEGWCLGAVPQPQAELAQPVNRLEAEEDADGLWRGEVNRRLATDYAALFGRIDLLVMLAVHGFEAVRANRRLQEEKLARRNPGGAGVMDQAALDRFVMHYERLTRATLAEMPARVDILYRIGPDQRPING